MNEMKLKPIDELFNIGESIDYIHLNNLDTFNNHPFSVVEDEDMKKLIESIRENSVITPIIVREKDVNRYEVISGHRRTYAARTVGLDKIPAIIKDMSDDQAVIAMVDANLQRENIKPSEKAKAYKMKLDAIKRQGIRTDLTSRQLVGKSESAGTISEDSGRQVQRYIRLTYLIPELLTLVDEGKIKLIPAVNLSYLSKDAQHNLYEALELQGRYNVSIKSSTAIRASAEKGNISTDDFLEILSPSDKEQETIFKINLCLKIPVDYVGIINANELEEICNRYINEKTAKETAI